MTAFLAPFALVLPMAVVGADTSTSVVREPYDKLCRQSHSSERGISSLPLSAEAPGWERIFRSVEPPVANQVRIERRIILRVSPARAPIRQTLTAQGFAPQQRLRLVEKRFGDCVDANRIAGVADRGDRLLVYLRDRQLLTARLEKGCSPRDFYQGFYMERSDDGKLCVERDRLMSRTGAKCQVKRLRRLVAERDD